MDAQLLAALALAGGIGIVLGYIVGAARMATLRSTIKDLTNTKSVLSRGVRDLTQERDRFRAQVDHGDEDHVARLEARLAETLSERDAVVKDASTPDFVRQESTKYRAMRNRAKATARARSAWNVLANAVNTGRESGAFPRFTSTPGKISTIE